MAWPSSARTGRPRAFKLREPDVVGDHRQVFARRELRGPRRDGQVARQSSRKEHLRTLQAWDQREPAHDRTGRSKQSPAHWPGTLKGGLDAPSTHAKCHSRKHRTPVPDVQAAFRHALGGSGSVSGSLSFIRIAVSFNDNRLPVMHQSIDQGRGQRVVRVTQGGPIPGKVDSWSTTIDPDS